MPPRLDMPLLSVRPEKMRRIDTRNVENLFGMWTGKDHLASIPPKYIHATNLAAPLQSSLDAQIRSRMVDD